jgi:hypothetical protein
MIKIKYFASGSDVGNYDISSYEAETSNPIYQLSTVKELVKNNVDIFNYANFFSDGISLNDSKVKLGDISDYYGWLIFKDDTSLIIDFEGETEPHNFENGIDITFNKYTCKLVEVYIETKDDGWVNIGTQGNDNGLPEKLHINLGNDMFPNIFEDNGWARFKINFSSPTVSGNPINVKGIFFGNSIEIKNIFEFDMISEISPISDDLAINEMNATANIDEDFVGRGGQVVEIYDNSELLENDVLKSIEETDIELYNIKTRNQVELLELRKRNYPYEVRGTVSTNFDWNDLVIYPADIFPEYSVPSEIYDHSRLSSFLPPCSEREMLQQVAWALCCGIDTTYKNKIAFIPFLASETTAPDIIINNSDDRILSTSVKEGEKYSNIIWERIEYIKSDELVTLAEIDVKDGEVSFDRPVAADFIENWQDMSDLGNNVYFTQSDPYHIKIWNNKYILYPIAIKGYEYVENRVRLEIPTGISNGATLEITNQTLYPKDVTEKMKQLKKWYSRNNTLSATVVDDNSEIRVGKIIKIQLKKGNYFQGVITKVIRNSINDYHTVELEAHEWN